MASPFKVFRKNQKAWMVALTVLAMISFLFLGNFSGSQRGAGGTRENPEVFSWKFGKVNASDLQNRIQLQHKVQQFFAATGQLAERTPQVINSFVANQFPTTENGVMTSMLLNKKAEELGIVISDDTIKRFIREWTEDKVSRQQLSEIVRSLSNNAGSINQAQLFDAIRFNLAATYALRTFQPNLVRYNQYMAWFHGDTPAERWEYFERLNRKATTEIMPVAVKDFVDKVPDPTAAELQTFYDEYKNAYPMQGSRTPGFREPYKSQIEYVKADNAKLIDEVLPTITDQEVAEYYEKHKDVSFRKSKLPDLPVESEDSKSTDATKDGAAAEKSAEKSSDAAKDSKDGAKTSDAKSSSTESKAPAAKSDAKSDTKADTKAAPKGDQKSNSSKSGSKSSKSGDGKQSGVAPRSSLDGELLAVADDPIYLAQKAADTGSTSDSAKKAAAAKDSAAKDSAAKDSAAKDSAAKSSAKDAKADVKADAKAATETKPATDKPAEAATTDSAAAATPGREVEYEPLEKVAGQAKNQIAQQKVDEKVLKGFMAIQAQMSRYRSALDAQHAAEIAGKTNVKQALAPNLEGLARDQGLQYKKTELVTHTQAADAYDIGKSRRPFQGGTRATPPSFIQVAFVTDSNSQPVTKLYSFEETEDNDNNHYLWWKVADQAARTLPLDQIKPEVILAWKQVKARKLASDKADEFAAQVNKSKQTLKEAFGGNAGVEIITPGPFSWLTRPAESPFAQPRMTEVTGLDRIGYEFMQKVFKLKTGETGVAPNDPLSVYYVVRMESEEPTQEALRQSFMTAMSDPMGSMTYAVIGAMDHGADMQSWFGDLEKQYDFKMAANYKPMNPREMD